MARFKVGVQLHPQATDVSELRAAWRAVDGLGVDSMWVWDHFYPLYGDPDDKHYEAYTLLAAMAVETQHAKFGALVTCNSYRNPNLLADMARTIDHLSGGRFILGIGSGWFERDYQEYGYEFGTAPERLHALAAALPVIKARLEKLNPPPVQRPLPIFIGGGGETVTLRLVAEHAQLWNTFGPPANCAHKNEVLDEWCARLGRDPKEIERTVGIGSDEIVHVTDYLDAGAEHMILMMGAPFDLGPVEQLLAAASD
ncbi:MAG TPA: LLM class F420-dependent oxidoreductase [Acidimicrobiia bacterium]|nr:LLM class F420-dependent oxidoreductase [Acidimicrobiia bacterium]